MPSFLAIVASANSSPQAIDLWIVHLLAILTSHPIQYQVPIWQAINAAGEVPFEVWYLTNHGLQASGDREFGREFAWDLDMLGGYPHQFLKVNSDWDMSRFRGVRLEENLAERIEEAGVKVLWIEGWRFSAMWNAVRTAHRAGIQVWMRGDSNDLKRDPSWKRIVKRNILGRHLRRVDRFLCVGSANRRLYESYGVPASKMLFAPHCVDNDRFASQAAELRPSRKQLREQLGIPEEAFCLLFCGKFVPRKSPLDVVHAANQMAAGSPMRPLHLLFVGTGELGPVLRSACNVVHDAEGIVEPQNPDGKRCNASFAGFLNQTVIAKAYVAADALVLPSDSRETWGLVVNEAMACGLPAVVSDQCGCAEDLAAELSPKLVFRFGDVGDLARAMESLVAGPIPPCRVESVIGRHHLRHTIATVAAAYRQIRATVHAK